MQIVGVKEGLGLQTLQRTATARRNRTFSISPEPARSAQIQVLQVAGRLGGYTSDDYDAVPTGQLIGQYFEALVARTLMHADLSLTSQVRPLPPRCLP